MRADSISDVNPLDLAVADAIVEVVEAKQQLDIAKRNVPGYTGDLDPEDYYADEQDRYNRAATKYVKELRWALEAPEE